MDEGERRQPKVEIASSLEDSRIQLLERTIGFLGEGIKNPEKLAGKPWWIGFFSSGASHKQALALEAVTSGLIPILLLEDKPDVRSPEINPATGEIEVEDYFSFLSTGASVPHGEAFTKLPLSEQAKIQAKLKAVFDFNVKPECPCVWATDFQGWVGTYPTPKTKDRKRQRETLERIARAGVIEGAIGVAAGEIKTLKWAEKDIMYLLPGEWRLWDYDNFVTGSLLVRATIDIKRMREKIGEYLERGQEEIRESGWVLNVFGPVCKEMGLVKGFEIGVGGGGRFREVFLDDANEVKRVEQAIAGYPLELLTYLLKKNGKMGIIIKKS